MGEAKPWQVPEGTRQLHFQIMTRTLFKNVYRIVKLNQFLPFQDLFVNHLKREQLVQKLVKGNINHP